MIDSAMVGEGPAANVRVPDDRGEVRVPVHSERLFAEKHEEQLGEIRLHRTVSEVQETLPVEVTREEVHVEQRDVPARPADSGELAYAFEEGVIRVPVHGEEIVVTKQTVVTGEIVVSKERKVERREIVDTVRREHVEAENEIDASHADQESHEAEPEVRAEPERRGGGAWDELRAEIREGWSRARGR